MSAALLDFPGYFYSLLHCYRPHLYYFYFIWGCVCTCLCGQVYPWVHHVHMKARCWQVVLPSTAVWVMTPLVVEQPFYRVTHQIPCISDIYTMIHNRDKVTVIKIWLRVTIPWGTVAKSLSIRKVESHCHIVFQLLFWGMVSHWIWSLPLS